MAPKKGAMTTAAAPEAAISIEVGDEKAKAMEVDEYMEDAVEAPESEAEAAAALVRAMETYESSVPDECIEYLLAKSGCIIKDERLRKVIALAAQKFMFDVTRGALRYCQHRKGSGLKKKKSGEETYTLTMEDLSSSLQDRGVNVIKPAYFVGRPQDLEDA